MTLRTSVTPAARTTVLAGGDRTWTVETGEAHVFAGRPGPDGAGVRGRLHFVTRLTAGQALSGTDPADGCVLVLQTLPGGRVRTAATGDPDTVPLPALLAGLAVLRTALPERAAPADRMVLPDRAALATPADRAAVRAAQHRVVAALGAWIERTDAAGAHRWAERRAAARHAEAQAEHLLRTLPAPDARPADPAPDARPAAA
ncbi:hypothetical protein ACWEQL_42050, partial [Kitasatospora sp. NPDC004240]